MSAQYVIIYPSEQADYDEEREEYIAPIVWSDKGKGGVIVFESLVDAKEAFERLKGLYPDIQYQIYKIEAVK